MKKIVFILLIVYWIFSVEYRALAVVSYTVTNLGSLYGSGSSSFPSGINDSGQAAGYSYVNAYSDRRAVKYANGTVTNLGTFGGAESLAYDINSAGVIVGYADVQDIISHAFKYANGTMTDLGTLGGTDSYAIAINSNNQIVGVSDLAGDIYSRGFIYQNGTMTPLNSPNGKNTHANDINMNGQIVGYFDSGNGNFHACRWVDGVMTDLGFSGAAYRINDSGDIVGKYGFASSYTAFLYRNNHITNLGTLGGGFSEAQDINNLGQIVGWSYISGTSDSRAFIYQSGHMVDLNSLVDPGLGWIFYRATAINNSGQIVGYGNLGAFMLTPIPEPTALWTLAYATATLMMFKLSRRCKSRTDKMSEISPVESPLSDPLGVPG